KIIKAVAQFSFDFLDDLQIAKNNQLSLFWVERGGVLNLGHRLELKAVQNVAERFGSFKKDRYGDVFPGKGPSPQDQQPGAGKETTVKKHLYQFETPARRHKCFRTAAWS